MRRLQVGKTLKLRAAPGHTVMCCAGTVWITQEGDFRDIFLAPGESFTFDHSGMALISAEAGARNEWVDDIGIAVICPLRDAGAMRSARG